MHPYIDLHHDMFDKIKAGRGFIAALDQSGGSTPSTLVNYGINPAVITDSNRMFELVHQMRTRIITSPAFNSDKIIGAILFENTVNSIIDDLPTADYLWQKRGIVPFLKIDQGLAEQSGGVQLMKPLNRLDELASLAVNNNIFGTKMRSVIHSADTDGIKELVHQQFGIAREISMYGLVPIIEPEVSISAPDKESAEELLLNSIQKELADWLASDPIMFKFTIPTKPDFYSTLLSNPAVIGIAALSGGYPLNQACQLLSDQHNMIASFSRALLSGLGIYQSDEDFDATLARNIDAIYRASLT